MSLVNQFEITLKDFLPARHTGIIIKGGRRTTTVLSNRLYRSLRAYAYDDQLPLTSVIEQLRDEIHGKPVAINFAKGDRIKLSAQETEIMPRMSADRSGTVAFKHAEGHWVAVLWDGTRGPRYMDPAMLERSDD
jgi:predicted DNA-binding ribbon-helix-helix protein